MTEKKQSENDLSTKVYEWLKKEGYPLEFEAANILQSSGFLVRQGEYVRNSDGENAREVDILASVAHAAAGEVTRVYHLIECKWSRDRPWVVFASPAGRMATSACAAQTISSSYGSALMWAKAGDGDLRSMGLFNSPERPGFNGREALGGSQDRFYNAMRSVTDLTTNLVEQYDSENTPKGEIPKNCVVAFPIILLDGLLFEAYFCKEHQKTMIEQVKHVRCHWRGSSARQLHSTIDIVTLDHFAVFARSRFDESKKLLRILVAGRSQVRDCFERKSLDPLHIKKGARGFLGIPPILRKAVQKDIPLSKSSP